MLVNLRQSANAEYPIVVTPFGIVMSVKLLQLENAYPPMVLTLSGMMMLVKLLHFSNAQYPILVTPFGMVILVISLQPLNALCPILVGASFGLELEYDYLDDGTLEITKFVSSYSTDVELPSTIEGKQVAAVKIAIDF